MGAERGKRYVPGTNDGAAPYPGTDVKLYVNSKTSKMYYLLTFYVCLSVLVRGFIFDVSKLTIPGVIDDQRCWERQLWSVAFDYSGSGRKVRCV